MRSQVPCVGCAHCGNHTHPDYSRARYNGSASSTAVSHTGTYHVGYAEGSSISGRMVSDTAWFASVSGSRLQGVPCTFGCQTSESGMFRSQVADGISGLSQGGTTLFDSLRTATSAPDVFSLCLDDEVGALVLGGAIPPEVRESADWIPLIGLGFYSVGLAEIEINGSRHF